MTGNEATEPNVDEDGGHGWDYALLDLSDGRPRVEFSNGQPSWDSINGRRLGWRNLNEAIARLVDDGWLLARVEHNTAPRIFHASLRPSAYRYRRPAPELPFVYRAVICPCAGERLRFYPRIVAEVEAAFSRLPSIIESCLELYFREGWEQDPYPSALDPQLVSPLLARWRRWTVESVKVRLRRKADDADMPDTASGDPMRTL